MYVCVCVCVCVYMYIYMYIYIYIHTYICIHICVCVYIYIYISHFLYPVTCWQNLGCSDVIMAIENNAPINWGCRYLFEMVSSFPLDIHPEVGLLDQTVGLLLTFWGTSLLFSIVAASALPSTIYQGFLYSTASPTLILSLIFLITAILTGVRGCIIVALICMS